MHGAKSEKKYTICSERTGPALNVSITRHKLFQKIPCLEKILREPEKLLDADFTLALACPKFPRDGKYFFERREENEKIHWPGREVVNKIEQLGCHVVPKPSKKTLASFQKEQMADSFLGTSAVLEWRYSFSQAEMVLSDHVPQAIRTSYLAFKAVIKTHINRVFDAEGLPHKIPSYALKTILFYELENMPVNFNAKEIEEKFFWILFESLQQKIDSKKCPHYWIKSLDLFSDIKEIDFEFMKDRLNRIKQRPIEYIASEWLEWNRYMRQHCCASCIEPYKLKRKVVGDDFKPLPCCCFVTLNMKRDKDDEEEVKIVYDDVAIEVY
ncbi:cyclic GMP-AMP synthase-like receptor 1 [Clytia hemisphaerica]|uniref:Uncharacterized protein n=1 Tax=Clytia hemisphaerica TaxID=252671 RepID=A0A7M6DQG5_9CNID